MFFKRKKDRYATRLPLRSPGVLIIDGTHYPFITLDLSLGGVLILLEADITPKKGTQVEFRLDDMEVSGMAELRWAKPSPDKDGTVIGLHFDNLQGIEERNRYIGKEED